MTSFDVKTSTSVRWVRLLLVDGQPHGIAAE